MNQFMKFTKYLKYVGKCSCKTYIENISCKTKLDTDEFIYMIHICEKNQKC